MSFELIETLKKSKLIALDFLIKQQANRRKNEYLLKDIVGFLTVYPTRPCLSVYLDLMKLPQPKEIAILHKPPEDEEPFSNSTHIVKVTSSIFRSIVDDSYIFDVNLNLKYYLIVKNGVPNALLKKEIATMFHQLSISEEYPLHIWKATGIDRKPTHFLRCKSSCTFYGNGWGVTVTFCPDAVLRVTGWVGMETFVAWDTGAPFIITTGTPPLLFTPKRSKIKFETEIEELEDFITK